MKLKPSALPPALQPVLLALGFALLVLIGGTSVWLVAQTDANSTQAVRTLEIKEKLANLQGLVWRAESNQRSFLLSGNRQYQEFFEEDKNTIGDALNELEAALGGRDTPLAAELRGAIEAELAMLQQAGEQGRSSATADPLEASRAEEIRARIRELVQNEQQALTNELAASKSTARRLLAASLSAVFLILLLAAASIAIVRRSTGRMMAAQKALKEANETLEETVARRTAELREANEEIQNFAYVVSHDLRAPLVNIMGFTSELEIIGKSILNGQPAQGASETTEDLGRDFDESLHFIKSSISRMDRLIKAILKLTREGRREFRMERIDMTDLVRSIAEGLGYQAQTNGASITVDPLPPLVGDRLALEQIFSNLLENALKYLREGTPGKIRVTGRAEAAETIYEVQDNGRGIEAKDRGRIFDLFRRSGPQDRQGEGIGLTHVKTLVRRLGGTIIVRSKPGEGSTFTVRFPAGRRTSHRRHSHDGTRYDHHDRG